MNPCSCPTCLLMCCQITLPIRRMASLMLHQWINWRPCQRMKLAATAATTKPSFPTETRRDEASQQLWINQRSQARRPLLPKISQMLVAQRMRLSQKHYLHLHRDCHWQVVLKRRGYRSRLLHPNLMEGHVPCPQLALPLIEVFQ